MAVFNECTEKLKQLEAALIAQQSFFTRARDSNVNSTKESYEVAMLITKHCKTFSVGEFVKDCMMQMMEKIYHEKKFAKAWVVARRTAEISSDIKRQLEAKRVEYGLFSLACNESMDASDTAQLLIFLRGVDNEWNKITGIITDSAPANVWWAKRAINASLEMLYITMTYDSVVGLRCSD